MTIYARALAVLILLSAAFAAGWEVNGWRLHTRLAELKTEYAQAQVAAVEHANAETIRLQTQAEEAARKQATRAAALAHDAAGARDALGRLRDTIANTAPVRVSGNPEAPASSNTDPARELFAQCAGALADLAKEADGHAADKLMLLEAWPR
jgi:hypothetical protein